MLDPESNNNSNFVKDPFQLGDPFSNSKPMTPNDDELHCSICGGTLKNTFRSGVDTCPNCGTPNCQTYSKGLKPHCKDEKNPNKGPNPTFIPKTVLNASYNAKEAMKKNIHMEGDEDVYTTEFDACTMENGIDDESKKTLNVDDRKDEVMKSCLDLEIDG